MRFTMVDNLVLIDLMVSWFFDVAEGLVHERIEKCGNKSL